MERLLIVNKNSYVEVPLIETVTVYQGEYIHKQEDVISIRNQQIEPYKMTEMEKGTFLYIQNNIHIVERKNAVFIGPKNSDIYILNSMIRGVIKDNKIWLNHLYDVFLNGVRLNNKEPVIETGDILQIGVFRIEIYNNYLIINAKKESYSTSLRKCRMENIYPDNFPTYHRSPRIVKKVDSEKVTIVNPPVQQTLEVKGVIGTFLPTVVTIFMSVGMGIIMGRGLLLVMMIMSSMMAFITNIIKYISNKKEVRLKNQKRQDMYNQYLMKTRKILFHKTEYNRKVMAYNFPDLRSLQRMIQTYNGRIYERTYQDRDFLEICIGFFSGESLFPIQITQEELVLTKDALKEQGEALQREFSYINGKPLSIHLNTSNVGLIGQKSLIHQQLKAYLMELTFFQSYQELQIVCLFHNQYKSMFEYLKWYPHMHIKNINVVTNISDERVRDQVMGSLFQILKERKNRMKERSKRGVILPHLLFIIDEPAMILNHPIMEYLQLHINELGYSIIYTSDIQAKLPENIKTVISLTDSEHGKLIINEGEFVDKSFSLLSTEDIDFEKNARILAGLIHKEKISSLIPESLDFLDMYGVETVEQLSIEELWKRNKVYQSISVPIGWRGEKEVVYLDLHEKAHGPHGLVAGTTGSGKSEVLQSYILSLAIHFHPKDVGFLLIDYKGGGMANLFNSLPHVLGIITNLDGSESMRAWVSVQSELHRRQSIFKEAGVNSINAYTKLTHKDKVKEPLPHIFIIADEFAELKKEQPEFMKELVSASRVGRSLGIHLILATQKPTGIVDDQIWSNARFKLCLRVQDEADSREMLKTSDAAMITQPGRCYLQVGNNEIYEVFQTAYSGGYYGLKQESKPIDNRVFLINALGQGEVINTDLSFEESDSFDKPTQLNSVVEHIHAIYSKMSSIEIRRPWLPMLPKRLFLPIEKQTKMMNLVCKLGVVDIPEKQSQIEYVIDLALEGNMGYFSSSGYGKSTFLSTVIISLTRKNIAQHIHLYILDFGSQMLSPFLNLAHTADYMIMDDTEKIHRFIKIIKEELKFRKEEFACNQTQNFILYNQKSNKKLPAIVILVDQLDAIKEIGVEEELFFSKLAREGVTLGIYLIFTATRLTDIRQSTLSHIKTKLGGYMFDAGERIQVVGRCKWKLPDSRGRMLVTLDEVYVAQMYLPVIFENQGDYLEKLKDLIITINTQNMGTRPKRIEVLPKQLYFSDMNKYEREQKENAFLGLDFESVKKKGYTFTNEPFLIIGPQRSGKTNALKLLCTQMKGNKYIFDTSKRQLNVYRNQKNTLYACEREGYIKLFKEIKEKIRDRIEQFNEAYKDNTNLVPQDFYRQLPICTCFIDDIDFFDNITKSLSESMFSLSQAVECGIHFIVCEESSRVDPLNVSAKFFRRTGTGLVLGSCVISNPFSITVQETPDLGYGLLINRHGRYSIMMAKFDD